MRARNEQLAVDTPNVCLINPAWMPEWFWLPVAHALKEQGIDYFIPPIIRDNPNVTVDDNLETIETTMQDVDKQYIVALSRGVEYAVRYLDRMDTNHKLSQIKGWSIISSAGPKGYDKLLRGTATNLDRHSSPYMAGVSIDEHGLETIEPGAVEDLMLHTMTDQNLKRSILENLVQGRPLSDTEIANVPILRPNVPRPNWYIGSHDRVDNPKVSAAIARQLFHVVPNEINAGHLSPLTQPREIANTIAEKAWGSSIV